MTSVLRVVALVVMALDSLYLLSRELKFKAAFMAVTRILSVSKEVGKYVLTFN